MMSWFYLFLKKPKIRAKLHVQQISDETFLFLFFFQNSFFPLHFLYRVPKKSGVEFPDFLEFPHAVLLGPNPLFHWAGTSNGGTSLDLRPSPQLAGLSPQASRRNLRMAAAAAKAAAANAKKAAEMLEEYSTWSLPCLY